MAKITAIDDDVGKPGKPPKYRRFPWRLWLWALVATATAGAGGYFVWHFRGESIAASTARDAAQGEAGEATKKLTETKGSLDACVTKRDGFEKDNIRMATEHGKLETECKAKGDRLTKIVAQLDAIEAREKEINNIVAQFEKMKDTGTLKPKVRNGTLVLSLPAAVLFPSGVAELSEDGKLKVQEVGIALRQFTDRKFLVIGHSDNQPPQKGAAFEDNLALSAARALTVTRHLIRVGMNAKNLLPTGAGDTDPLVPNTSAQNLQTNRRIEIALVPAVSELPPMPASLDKAVEGKPDKPDPAKKP